MSILNERTAGHELRDPAAQFVAIVLPQQSERGERFVPPLQDAGRGPDAREVGETADAQDGAGQ